MKVLIVKEIQPQDKQTCSDCHHRDGHVCALFQVSLKPLSFHMSETRCKRARECKQAERRALSLLPKKELT